MSNRKYDFFARTYNVTTKIDIVENCNAITVTNTGDAIAYLDAGSLVLYPGTIGSILGDSRTIGGNEDEILARKQLQLQFDAAGTTPAIEVIQKFYVK